MRGLLKQVGGLPFLPFQAETFFLRQKAAKYGFFRERKKRDIFIKKKIITKVI